MISLELFKERIQSQSGSLPISEDDEITRKLAMLIAGECGSEGIDQAAAKFNYSRQRYFQVRALFLKKGAEALLSSKRGPKRNYRRTQELVCQVIRHRFLDPEASTEVIAQKLRQCDFRVSKRTVDRVINQFGLQKKNSTSFIRNGRLSSWRPTEPSEKTAAKNWTTSASNATSANYWQIRSRAIWSVCGCWRPNTFGWEPGTC